MIFTIPEDALPPVRQRLKAGASLEVRVLDRAQKNELGVGKLDTTDNVIDIDDRHGEAARASSTTRTRACSPTSS